MNLKIDQIKKLASRMAYKEAVKIADEINWQKVKEWSSLSTVINVQEAVGNYEEARDMAILAYNRNLGGRRLVYKLTELFIKLKQFDEAEELYDEYERMASRDASRFVLFYELRKAQGAEHNELIEILEEYKKQEVDEKYMLDLAKLYVNTGRKEEAVKVCDDIAIMFQDGEYVERAMLLKQELGVNLNKMQKKLLEEEARRKEDVEATKEIRFKQQHELNQIMRDEIDDVFAEDEGREPVYAYAPLIDEPEAEDVYTTESEDDEELSDEDIAAGYEEAVFEEAEFDEEPDGDMVDFDEEEEPESSVNLPDSLKALIENAKKKIDNDYDRINKENEEERIREEREAAKRKIEAREAAMEIEEIAVPNYSVYDTQNIQAELAKNLSELLTDDEELDMFRPNPVADTQESVRVNTGFISQPAQEETPVETVKDNQAQEAGQDTPDDQIEGQMSLADWIESVREEKYGKQNTKQYSKEELERLLDEKDEKSAAYEKLVEEQKSKAVKNNETLSDEQAKQKAREQMIINAARTDLTMRTGKAVFKLEEAFSKPAVTKAVNVEKKSVVTEDVKAAEAVVREAEKAEQNEIKLAAKEAVITIEPDKEAEISLNTAQLEPITDEMLAVAALEKMVEEELENETRELEEAEVINEDVQPKVKRSQVVREKRIEESANVEADYSDRKLTSELATIFRKYKDMPGLEGQLVELFDTIDGEMSITTSSVGNIIISGNSTSDKTDLARTIVKAINKLYPDNQKKIAKTTGESINQRGLAKAMLKLKDTVLIVEGAGVIEPRRISEIMVCLEQETDRMVVIFEDSDADINMLLSFNPDLSKYFNHRIVLKQYTVNELVDMAKRFARKRQYEVGDDALLELYLKIDKLHSFTDNIRLDDIKDIINEAIDKSEKRASRRLFGGLKKKRSDSGDFIFLTEADFKD